MEIKKPRIIYKKAKKISYTPHCITCGEEISYIGFRFAKCGCRTWTIKDFEKELKEFLRIKK